MAQIQTPLDKPLTFKRLSGTNNSKDSVRVIVFPILDYLFALSVRSINKIIPCPPFNLNFENGSGTIDLGQQTITIVDLRYKLIAEKNTQVEPSHSQNCFLILIQTITGEPCGIFIEQSPLLSEIPLKNIRPVPLSYGQIGKIDFVSHMAILPKEEAKEPLKIFLVGMNQIIARKLGISLPKTPLLVTETQEREQRKPFLPVVLGEGEGLFPIDSVCCAIRITVEEICPTPAFPQWVLGVYNWKGQMLRLIDFDRLMGYPPVFSRQLQRKTPVTVVIQWQNQFFGFLVANVYDVESYEVDKMKGIDDNNCPSQIEKFIQGVFPEQRWVLDLDRLFKTLRSLNN